MAQAGNSIIPVPPALVALSRVAIAQRERTIALRPTGGLVAHTLHEQRDINDAKAVFEDATTIKTDPEMIALARQLIDPSDIEDRYARRGSVSQPAPALPVWIA